MPSNYETIMISHILSKLHGIILENKISFWLEIHAKKAKGQARFMRYHSIMDHHVTLRIIVEEFHNNKINHFCCFLNLERLLTPFQ